MLAVHIWCVEDPRKQRLQEEHPADFELKAESLTSLQLTGLPHQKLTINFTCSQMTSFSPNTHTYIPVYNIHNLTTHFVGIFL